jgi:hypothetical protein
MAWNRVVACAVVAACGRVGFDPVGDAARDASTGPALRWVGPFVQHVFHSPTTNVDTFTAQAQAAGDAVALHVECDSTTLAATGVTVTGPPGWSFRQLGTLVTAGGEYATSFGAIAPDTTPATFTITWTIALCDYAMVELGDELANNAAGGSALTFDAHVETSGVGDCVAAITTAQADEAIWAACTSTSVVSDVGTGFTKGADDTAGDWSEYRITTDPALTVEPVAFHNDPMASYVLTALAIRPR